MFMFNWHRIAMSIFSGYSCSQLPPAAAGHRPQVEPWRCSDDKKRWSVQGWRVENHVGFCWVYDFYDFLVMFQTYSEYMNVYWWFLMILMHWRFYATWFTMMIAINDDSHEMSWPWLWWQACVASSKGIALAKESPGHTFPSKYPHDLN